ncbi:flagellar basal body rod modification protein [Campylobacter jejuni]|uniref:flagellar basal body rod modification protein n=1 Tax=Campylobacter sp. 2014D-0259 TaxID=1595915 RepID=UPI0011ADD5F2|nr:flagellar basal body rod modification protein [Campylobacter sp. 2014D-0259]EAH5409017.1 flagellar basal body rod modification protein [Campylobacter jejuni]EAH9699070.1 flagellar basal body rod modification protein [Campylobacter jejuni]EAI0697682.1 flagellar basal body rod modification protein [Campylobacter jejuni]EAJ6966588.1 flagellar basal body rod modification protein [Campylobacter jejuni]EAK3318538.1 flagellar basal body rod modification protein [Campylobacter jejuni]
MISSSDWNLNTAATTSGTTSSGSISGTTRTDSSSSSGIVSNPNATLDKDAFLKLLLIELQHQDPTDPMDSDKMLTQTSQLSALEMQQNTNTTMQKMVETMQKLSDSFSTSMSTSALGAIGKMATVSDNKIKLTGADELIALKMYLPEDSDENGVTLEIYDSNNKLVFSEKSDAKSISQGLFTMEWPGRNNDGVYAGDGEYTVKMVYNNKNGEKITANYGTYPIEGVVFKDGVAYAKMAGQEVPFDAIQEITDYKLGSSSSTGGSGSSGDSSGGSSDGDSSGSGSTEDGDKEEKA